MPTLSEPGSLHFLTDQQPWQRTLRWVRPESNRRLLLWGGLFALAVTVLQLVGFALVMRSYPGHPRLVSAPIQVVLIEPEVLDPLPPEPEPPIVARPSRIAIAPPEMKKSPPPPPRPDEASQETKARIGTAGSAVATPPAPQLFNPDGSIRLGVSSAPVAPQGPKNPQEAAKARWAQIEQRGNPIDCKKTRFANAFAADQNAGDKVASKYLKWIGLADGEAIGHRRQQRSESGGCEPAN
ncbi:MAG: hypothetical protein ABIR62_15915 [Dokdonella sp.]|uniref:hypothetical protein n=1 Tax=Dokdonella sp. TaxID=2291710 RepID=UPI003263B6E8